MGLELRNIKKVFKSLNTETVAVKDFNQNIEEGKLVTLLGPSGCGKTTTLRMIAGFEIPTGGRVFLNDVDVTNLPPNKRNISMVFQSYALFPHLSVEDNISFGLKIKHLNKKEIAKKINAMIDLVGLRGLEKRRPEQLSGGQQQRVALARSLIMEPLVLLFDEPLSNLDAKLRESMRLEIRRIQQGVNITSVYVTHDQVEAMSISDIIVVMNKGEVMQIGNPFEIYAKPKNSFVADFIGRVNFIDGKVESLDGEYVVLNCPLLRKKVIGINGDKLEIGDSARVVLRPESLSDKKESRENSIEGEISKFVFLGSNVEYELLIGDDKRINAVTYNPIERKLPVVNQKTELYFSKESAWIIRN
ncbi:MAG: iron(III) transport system ATP-binding protein [Kosmotogales bacterium]|nr:iron(III) transport system ATP-binding protein [Kosmotogales bacterium]